MASNRVLRKRVSNLENANASDRKIYAFAPQSWSLPEIETRAREIAKELKCKEEYDVSFDRRDYIDDVEIWYVGDIQKLLKEISKSGKRLGDEPA